MGVGSKEEIQDRITLAQDNGEDRISIVVQKLLVKSPSIVHLWAKTRSLTFSYAHLLNYRST